MPQVKGHAGNISHVSTDALTQPLVFPDSPSKQGGHVLELDPGYMRLVVDKSDERNSFAIINSRLINSLSAASSSGSFTSSTYGYTWYPTFGGCKTARRGVE